MEVIFERDNQRVKKSQNLQKNIFFIIYSPKTVTVETANCVKIDTSIILNLPKKAKAFITWKFREHKIYEINNEKRCLWIEVLNTSYTEDLKIKKNSILGFLVFEPENLKFKYAIKKKTKRGKGLPKNWEQTWRTYWKKRSLRIGGFLNRYDFAYAGRDVVNQAGKISPNIIKQATGEIDKIA